MSTVSVAHSSFGFSGLTSTSPALESAAQQVFNSLEVASLDCDGKTWNMTQVLVTDRQTKVVTCRPQDHDS